MIYFLESTTEHTLSQSLSDILTVPNFKRSESYGYNSDGGQDSPDEPHSRSNSLNRADANFNKSPLAATAPLTDTPEQEASVDHKGLRHPSPSFTSDEQSDGTESAGSVPKPARHIAFSHRVEQCIAVDSDEDRDRYNAPTTARSGLRGGVSFGSKLQRQKGPGGSQFQHDSTSDDDDEDDSDGSDEEEDQVLSIRSTRSASLGHHNSHRHHPSRAVTLPANEPYTIAKLAPTILKGSEALPSPSPAIVCVARAFARRLTFYTGNGESLIQ